MGKKKLDESEAFIYLFQTALAIEYLHMKKIVHRDLKLENLLLDENGNIKLCDFGFSVRVLRKDDLRSTYCGTLEMMAPEMLGSQKYGSSVDIWALGTSS